MCIFQLWIGNQNQIITKLNIITLRQLVPVLGSNVTINVPFVFGATRAEWAGEKVL